MNQIEKLLNQTHQRAGLLAVIAGVVQTTSCSVTKKSIANSLKRIFSEYVVDDDIENLTKLAVKEALEEDNNEKDQVKEMMDQIMNILKN